MYIHRNKAVTVTITKLLQGCTYIILIIYKIVGTLLDCARDYVKLNIPVVTTYVATLYNLAI